MPRLVVIDADEAERRRIVTAFTATGFDALQASGSVQGLLQVLEFSPDLIILAEEMPPLRAADLLVIIRRTSDAPIIVIGRGGEPEEVAALEAGADSYIPRRASLGLLKAHAHALLRRSPRQNGALSSTSRLPIPISLTRTERRLLTCLVNHYQRPVSLEELRQEVWGEQVGLDTVRYYLRSLRNRLEAQPCGLELRCTRGVGYRVVRIQEVRPVSVGRAAMTLAAPGEGAGVA